MLNLNPGKTLSRIIRKWVNHPVLTEICALLLVQDDSRDLPFKRALLMLWFLGAGFILYLGIRPTPLPVDAPFDKLVHCFGNALLMMLPAIIYKRLAYTFIWAGLLVLAGIGVELYQNLLPGRVASVYDVIADSGGIILGAMMGRLVRRGYGKHHEHRMV